MPHVSGDMGGTTDWTPYCAYLVMGLKDLFRIGFNCEGHTCSSAVHNMQSVTSQACVVHEYLASEVKTGRVLGPVPPEQAQSLQVNRLGLVPKAHQSGKWRLIVDLSFPNGSSVNDGIKSEECSLHYTLHARECWLMAEEQSWKNLMFRVPLGQCPCTLTTGAPRDALEGQGIRRQGPSFRPEVSSKGVQCSGR